MEYREKFRSCKQATGETYKEFSVRMRTYFDHWKENEAIGENFDKLVDLILREQLTFSSDHDLQIWLREHQPKKVSDLVNLAEAYQLAHKESDNKKYQKKSFQFQFKTNKPNTDEKSQESPNKSIESNQRQEKRKCFICNSTEHLIASCPFKVNIDKTQTETGNRPRQANSLLYSPKKQEHIGKIIEIPAVPRKCEEEVEPNNGLMIMKRFCR